ncbi:hypothetical protein Taro_022131 [Colocasia esculenta]|uniref:Retrotransposon gag domain-containing protein n=1 Tax=Colocasia esculenta TaxID=4460 RepID=A0A843VDK4_COLES|nr:hypothetical protein [Colocasia esculenta]
MVRVDEPGQEGEAVIWYTRNPARRPLQGHQGSQTGPSNQGQVLEPQLEHDQRPPPGQILRDLEGGEEDKVASLHLGDQQLPADGEQAEVFLMPPTRAAFQAMTDDAKYDFIQRWQVEMANLLMERGQQAGANAPCCQGPAANPNAQGRHQQGYPPDKLPPDCPKAPKLQKFDEQVSPNEHLAYYIMDMGELAFDESYLLRYFATSLTGTAFQWYSRLRPNSIVDWADPQKKFIDRFQTAERKVSLAELCSLKQRKGETALDFIKQWRDFSIRCDNPPTQEDAITIYRRGLEAEKQAKQGACFWQRSQRCGLRPAK